MLCRIEITHYPLNPACDLLCYFCTVQDVRGLSGTPLGPQYPDDKKITCITYDISLKSDATRKHK